MAGINEYDTFTYEKAPDYTKSFDQAANLNAWGSASQQEDANAKTRMANAKAMENAFNSVYKMAPTLAKTYKDHAERRDKRLMNEAYQIHLEAGITQQKLRDYHNRNKDKEGYIKDVSFYNEAAAEARKNGNLDLARDLENITGHRLVMAKQSLLRNSAMNWKAGFDARKNDIKIDRGDGTFLTIGNAKDAAEYGQIVREYNLQMGFNDVSWASSEFIDKEFRPTFERQQALGLSEFQNGKEKQQLEERHDGWREALITGAGTNQLGQVVYDLMNSDWAFSKNKTKSSMREDLRDMIAVEIDRFKHTNGAEGIDPASLGSLENFTFYHDGDKKQVPLSKFKEFDNTKGGGLAQAVITAQTERLQAHEAANTNKVKEHEITWNAGIEEHGLPTQAEVALEIQNFHRNNPTISTTPAHLLNAYTVEKRDDDEQVAAMYAKAYRGIPLNQSDWSGIKDENKRKKAKEFAQGPGGSGIHNTAARDSALKAAVSTKLSEFGLGTKSSEHGIMLQNATAAYNKLYIDLAGKNAFGGDQSKLHDYVAATVEKQIERGEITGVRAPIGDPRSFTRSLNEGRLYILDANKGGKKMGDLLSTELIPGSKEHYARLEAYAKNPLRMDIPQYYKQLANDFKQYTAWDIANMQYMSQTGKELPKPKSIVDLEKKSPLTQYMYRYRTNGKRIDRADKIESGYDFNSEGSLIPGLVFQEATVG
tara:strand:- start:69 stop:2192 length:2124 start_codon:yes stop_codon:yes gene_type:complete